MRLIGSLNSQQEAFTFQRYCRSKKIELLLDKENSPGKQVQVWVVNEDDTEKALEFLEAYKKDPASPEFYINPEPVLDRTEYDTSKPHIVQKNPRLPILTWLWIIFSVICFFIQMGQEVAIVKEGGVVMMEAALTPIEQNMFFDIPDGFEKLTTFVKDKGVKTIKDFDALPESDKEEWKVLKETAYFHGFLDMLEDPIYKEAYKKDPMPLFQKLRQGQLHRLITPVFLHGSILHILFNMIWLFVLMKQIEMKIGAIKTLFLSIAIGIVSNVIQYIVTGPFFVGASGIIVGLAAFIWIRQKKAPWEGYLLAKPLIFFLMIYVMALALLSFGIFVFNVSSEKDLPFGIANTAHVVGGLTGLWLGATSLFRRR